MASCLKLFLLTMTLFVGLSSYWIQNVHYNHSIDQIEDLSKDLQKWEKLGSYYKVFNHSVFVIDSWPKIKDRKAEIETIILIHGFPTSSYDYHRALDYLNDEYRVVIYDHLGFGFSDKPTQNFTYSLINHADVSLDLWRQLGIKKAHLIAHDMGDSILTEIISRRQRKLLPSYFKSDFFKSVMFGNGGMKYDLINQRIGQILLKIPIVGPILNHLIGTKLPLEILSRVQSNQLKSVWGPKFRETIEEDVNRILELNRFKGGHLLMHKLIEYLPERYKYEQGRWFPDLESMTDIPYNLVWGDSDSVAPLQIPLYLIEHVFPSAQNLSKNEKRIVMVRMLNVGHFMMLENAESWTNRILEFISEL